MRECRDIAYEEADKKLEAGEADFTINVEELAKACQSSTQIAAKGGPHDNAHAAKTRRRGGGGVSCDGDDSGVAAGGKLQGRQKSDVKRPVSVDSKRPTNVGKGTAGKGISQKNSGF